MPAQRLFKFESLACIARNVAETDEDIDCLGNSKVDSHNDQVAKISKERLQQKNITSWYSRPIKISISECWKTIHDGNSG